MVGKKRHRGDKAAGISTTLAPGGRTGPQFIALSTQLNPFQQAEGCGSEQLNTARRILESHRICASAAC